MILHDYYYDYDIRTGHFEFLLKEDGVDVIRELNLSYDDIIYYATDIVDDDLLFYMTDSFVKDLINNYIKERGMPPSTYF